MCSSSQGLVSIAPFYILTSRVAWSIGQMLKCVWPDHFRQYDEAFKAGQFWEEDPGPFLGRAVVYKLQVDLHKDNHDAGPSACFPAGSWESGGELLVPQLGAKFQYG